MKIRTAFVSNSSSSSFCVGKNYMTPEQVKQFREYLDNPDNYDEEVRIEEGKYYFFGETTINDDNVENFLKSIGVNMRYVEGYC